MSAPILDIRNLRVEFLGRSRAFTTVDGLDLQVGDKEILGLVGESGSGKTAILRAILGLLPGDRSRVSGSIRFEGGEILGLDERGFHALRGSRIALAFQNPREAFDPLMRVGRQIREALEPLGLSGSREADREVVRLLSKVGIADPERRARQYPH